MPRRRAFPRDVMIVDYDKCLRVPSEDALLARKSVPMRCPLCVTPARSLTNSGRLMFDGEQPPLCEDHDKPVRMVPVNA